MEKVKFTTMIDASLLKKIKIVAIKEERSVSDILNDLISEYLAKKGEE